MATRKKKAESILDAASYSDKMKELMLRKGSKNTLSESRIIIPFRHPLLEHLFNYRGLISGRVIDILGGDATGKTTLGYTLIGDGCVIGCPAMHVESENKEMDPDRICRALHWDRNVAQKFFNEGVYRTQAFDVVDCFNQILTWARLLRDPASGLGINPQTPGIVVVDTWSKLMSRSEAIAVGNYAVLEEEESQKTEKEKEKSKKAKVKIKELGKGSNMEHAKLAHEWMRQLPYILSHYNLTIVFCRHQNQKVDMVASPVFAAAMAKLTPEQKDQTNRTSIGGNAFNQNAAWQVVLAKKQSFHAIVDGEKVTIAVNIGAKMCKSSYGPPRSCEYQLITTDRDDTDTWQAPCLDMDGGFFDLLAKRKMLTMNRHNQNSVSCKELKLTEVHPREFMRELRRRPELYDDIIRRLNILGYGPNFIVPKTSPIVLGISEMMENEQEATIDDVEGAK